MSYVSFAAEVCLGGPPLGMGVDSDISPMDGALSMAGTLSMTHTGEVSTMNVWFMSGFLVSSSLVGLQELNTTNSIVFSEIQEEKKIK